MVFSRLCSWKVHVLVRIKHLVVGWAKRVLARVCIASLRQVLRRLYICVCLCSKIATGDMGQLFLAVIDYRVGRYIV